MARVLGLPKSVIKTSSPRFPGPSSHQRAAYYQHTENDQDTSEMYTPNEDIREHEPPVFNLQSSVFILIVAAQPFHAIAQALLVPAFRNQVEQVIRAVEQVETAGEG